MNFLPLINRCVLRLQSRVPLLPANLFKSNGLLRRFGGDQASNISTRSFTSLSSGRITAQGSKTQHISNPNTLSQIPKLRRNYSFQSSFSYMKNSRNSLLLIGAGILLGGLFLAKSGKPSAQSSKEELPIEEAQLAFAPNVPPPITRKFPVRLRVNLTTSVQVLPIDPFYNYEFWTFGDQVPGPFIRARVGDTVEVTLTNKDQSGMLHNIDCHAFSGPGGGAPITTAGKDETKDAVFKLLYPGLFIYHCAVDPVGVHVGNGMYGLMLVEPEEGLPKVDKEYYILQSEFYTEENPEDKESKILPFSFENGVNENPNYVVFNGRVGSLTEEENRLKVKTGDKIRIFFGNAGPNLISSFHIIGTIMDKVYREGDLISPPARGIQTTLVPAGGATVVEINPLVPGNYTLLDHSLFRLEKGAVGFIQAEGEPNRDIYHSEDPPITCVSCRIHP